MRSSYPQLQESPFVCEATVCSVAEHILLLKEATDICEYWGELCNSVYVGSTCQSPIHLRARIWGGLAEHCWGHHTAFTSLPCSYNAPSKSLSKVNSTTAPSHPYDVKEYSADQANLFLCFMVQFWCSQAIVGTFGHSASSLWIVRSYVAQA